MKLYSVQMEGRYSIGLEHKGQLIDLLGAYRLMISAKGPKAGLPAALPPSMLSYLRLDPDLIAAKETATFVARRPAVPVGERIFFTFDEVKLLPPIARPGKILCFDQHHCEKFAQNGGEILSEEPHLFTKLPSSVIGPEQQIELPTACQQVDYSAELAIIIGKRMRQTNADQVMQCIAGYTLLNDVFAPNSSLTNQTTLNKNFDTFCPTGPCIATKEELPNPEALRLISRVNGEVIQEGLMADWISPLPKLLEFLAARITLEPGDIISIGRQTGIGHAKKVPVNLKIGDIVEIEAGAIGLLCNSIAARNP